VDECRPQIVIPVCAVRGVVAGLLGVSMGVRVSAAQQPGAHDVHQQAETSDRNSLAELDVNGRQKAPDGLVADEQGNEPARRRW